jgi:hypothetical protein
MAQCMAMGHAAGTAAAMATRSGREPRAIDIGVLRERLVADGAILALEPVASR